MSKTTNWISKWLNKVAVELRVLQSWSEIILVISNQTLKSILKSRV